MANEIKQLLQERSTKYYILCLMNIILWFIVLKPTNFIGQSMILLGFFALTNLLIEKKLKKLMLQEILLVFWLIKISYYIAGAVFGTIGLIIISLAIMLRRVIKAVTSDYYKNSIDDIVKTIKRGKER